MKTIKNLTADQLRKSILQLAIQGKLVKQDPNDEPASVLVEKIYAEKKKLIAEGKIKKEKFESYIYKGDDNRYYEKIGKRNKKKDDLHLNKHAMHLIRLFMMALDILEKGEINTCRVKEHDLLMDIRFGKYQKEDGTFQDSFYDMLADFEKRLHYASENTDLPEEPDMKRVQELVMTINERVIRDEI